MTRNTLGLGTLATLILLLGFASTPAAQACFCNCNWSADCEVGEVCAYKADNCIETTSPNGLPLDGLCKKRSGSVETTEQARAAQALDLWLRAFHQAGAHYGGEPQAALLSGLEGIDLNPRQLDEIREIALGVLGLTVGYTAFPDTTHHQPGFFSAPLVVEAPAPAPCGTTTPDQIDNGVVAPLDTTLLAVLDIVREGAVAELLSPGMGFLDGAVGRIAEEYPEYATVGQCEVPAAGSVVRFPYADGLGCLREELRRRVHSLLAQPVPAQSGLTLRRLGGAP